MEMLKKDPNIENPEEYISFYGLRNHSVMNGKPVTEIIYVHSKVWKKPFEI
jgi:phospholipase D1/2